MNIIKLVLVLLLTGSVTVIAQPRTLEINMPSNNASGGVSNFPDDVTITLLLAKDHKIWYYDGLKPGDTLKVVGYGDLHKLLARKKKEKEPARKVMPGRLRLLHVIIKPGEESTYADLVDILDEMSLSKIKYYAIVDITDIEKQRIK